MTSKFPERAKMMRKKKKITAQRVAEAAGIDRTTLYKYERGESDPPLEVVKKWRLYLKLI